MNDPSECHVFLKDVPLGAGTRVRDKGQVISNKLESYGETMNKRQKWVRADKLQPGDRVQDAKGNVVMIKEVSQGIFPG